MGLLNETHEPDTFYGVERNQVESIIIPSTYRVNGVKFAGKIVDGLSYDFAAHEGLQLANNFSVRSSRQAGSRANAQALATTFRIKYSGVPGLELGASLQYQSDLVQVGVGNSRLGRDAFDANGSVNGLLTEAHLAYRAEQGFGLRALYARWDIDDEITALGGVGWGAISRQVGILNHLGALMTRLEYLPVVNLLMKQRMIMIRPVKKIAPCLVSIIGYSRQ
jgi:hypothetical protein